MGLTHHSRVPSAFPVLYFLTVLHFFPCTHAKPSGCFPVDTDPLTSILFKSTTATFSFPLTATYAREPSGTITIPAAPPPRSNFLTSFRVAASSTTRLLPAPPPSPEINTRVPSGVNFSRFVPRTEIGRVCVARLLVTSMMVTVASCALAAQISLPSGDTSKPSVPCPAAMLVTRHVFRGPLPCAFYPAPCPGPNRRFASQGRSAQLPCSSPP